VDLELKALLPLRPTDHSSRPSADAATSFFLCNDLRARRRTGATLLARHGVPAVGAAEDGVPGTSDPRHVFPASPPGSPVV